MTLDIMSYIASISIATNGGITKKVPDTNAITVTVPVVAMQMHDRGIHPDDCFCCCTADA